LAHTPEDTAKAEETAKILRSQGFEVITSREAAIEAGKLKEWEEDKL